MNKQEFYFDLPASLIADYPAEPRSACRLLHLHAANSSVQHRQFSDLVELLREGDCLVINNSQVIAARLYARKATGGRAEILVERLIDEQRCLAQLRASKKSGPGTRLDILAHDGNAVIAQAEIVSGEGGFFCLQLSEPGSATCWQEVLTLGGHIPLPPYINRADDAEDQHRYQTVYATHPGSVAAPTAGLHFDAELLRKLRDKGVAIAPLTLHVGAGTFQPLRVDDIRQHTMHTERVHVSEDACKAIRQCWASNGRVVAVGTTSVRALETAAQSRSLQAYDGESDLFITPGYRFQCIDAMITNFHLPESTLLMMVAAFAGKKFVLDAYQTAIEHEYRFYSYGDAMLIEGQGAALRSAP